MHRLRRIRALDRLVLAVLALSPALACALGLGELQLDSRLNQPFRARVQIMDVSDDDWRSVTARLVREGESTVDNVVFVPGLLDGIKVRTFEDAEHHRFVELQSTSVLTEPMFDLPLEVRGGTSRVIRNFSVLLDPPRSDEPTVMVAGQRGRGTNTATTGASINTDGSALTNNVGSAAAGSETNTPAAGRARSGTGSSRNTANTAEPAAPLTAGGATYVVQKTDTLQRIARRFAGPSPRARTEMAQWLYEHNPEAFYGPHRFLHANARLTLPAGAVASEAASAAAAPGQNATPRMAPAAGSQAAQPVLRSMPIDAGQPVPHGVAADSAHGTTAVTAASSATDQLLHQQLATLQQTLLQLQQSISDQDTKIATLTARIASTPPARSAVPRDSAEVTRSAPAGTAAGQAAAAASRADEAAADSEDDEDSQPHSRWSTFGWTIGLGLLLIAGVALWIYRRSEEAPRGSDERSGKAVVLGPPPAAITERFMSEHGTPATARQASASPAYPPIPKFTPVPSRAHSDKDHGITVEIHEELTAEHPRQEVTPSMPEEATRVEELAAPQVLRSGSAAHGADLTQKMDRDTGAGLSASGDDPAVDETELNTELLPHAYLNELPDSYTADVPHLGHLEDGQDPQESADPEFETQSREALASSKLDYELPEAYLRGPTTPLDYELPEPTMVGMVTEKIPNLELEDDAATVKVPESPAMAAAEEVQEGDMTRLNRQVVEILEGSPEDDADEVRAKLLEIYHHQVVGNKADFTTLLNKLVDESSPRLSPEQREQLETLRRTLGDDPTHGKRKATG